MDEGQEEVRECAHQIWLKEGCPVGKDLEHWRQAEAEISAEAEKVPTVHDPKAQGRLPELEEEDRKSQRKSHAA